MSRKFIAILTAKRKGYDVLIVSLLVIATFIYALSVLHKFKGHAEFYQQIFGPAVMSACGKGFTDLSPYSKAAPKLRQFLNTKTKAFSCQLLPETPRTGPLDRFQVDEYYLLHASALVWRIFGVSWPNLFILNALLFAMMMAALYGILRLGMGNLLALLCVIAFIHFGNTKDFLPQLRDFSIAPFIFLFIYLFALLVRYSVKTSTLLLIAIAAGATLGIGLGFRDDILVYMPLFIITVLFFMPEGITKRIPIKLVTITLFLAVMIGFMAPLYAHSKQTGNLFHVILLGFTDYISHGLGVTNSPVYDPLYKYSDGFVASVVQVYAYYIHKAFPVLYMGKFYGHFASLYFWEIVKTFPADMFIRILASIVNVLDINQYARHHDAYHIIRFGSVFVTIAGILVARVLNLRYALFMAFLILFFGSYPVLQFQSRHTFYLMLIPMWMIGFIAQASIFYFPSTQLRQTLVINWRSIIMFLMIPSLLLAALYYGLISYQHHHLVKLFNRYETAKLTPIKVKSITKQDGVASIKFASPITQGDFKKPGVKYGYLMVLLNGKQCPTHDPVMMRFYYHVFPPFDKYTGFYSFAFYSKVNVKGNTKVFAPIYDTRQSLFEGVKIPSFQLACIKGFYRVDNVAQYPLQLVLKLPANWQQMPLHQTIGNSSLEMNFPKVTYIAPKKVAVPPKLWQSPVVPPKLKKSSKLVKQLNNSIEVNGSAKSKYRILASFVARQFTSEQLKQADYYFIAEGKRYYGGFSLGFISQRKWIQRDLVNVVSGQDFKIAIKVLHAGIYMPTLANNLIENLQNHFIITKYGWVKVEHKNHDA